MTNFNQLEQAWRKYKIKQYLFYTSITLVSILAVALIWFFATILLTEDVPNNNSKPKSKISKNIKKQQKVFIEDTKPAVKELYPSFNFMNKIKNEPKKISKRNKINIKKRVKKTNNKIKKNSSKRKVKKTSTNNKLKQKRSNSKKVVLPKITSNKTQKYSNKSNYKQLVYFVEINKIDPTKKNSWRVTAKSLYLLNTLKAATLILNKYLNNKNPNSALMIVNQYNGQKISQIKKDIFRGITPKKTLKRLNEKGIFAIEVDRVNPTVDDSWILKAKSKVFLKNKKIIYNILKNYLMSNNLDSALIFVK